MTEPSEQALPFSEAAREAATRELDATLRGFPYNPWDGGPTRRDIPQSEVITRIFTAADADPRAKAFLELAQLSDEELVERAKRAIDVAVGGALDDDELTFYARIPLAALGLPVEQETTG